MSRYTRRAKPDEDFFERKSFSLALGCARWCVCEAEKFPRKIAQSAALFNKNSFQCE